MSEPVSPLRAHSQGTLIELRIQPRASRSEIVDVRAGQLRLRVAAPPVDGAANTAVVELLADRLAARKSDIEIVSGLQGRSKRVVVRGKTPDDVRARLGLS